MPLVLSYVFPEERVFPEGRVPFSSLDKGAMWASSRLPNTHVLLSGAPT